MKTINLIQIESEAKNIVNFNAKARKCGGNRLRRKCNCYGLTLKYLFSMKGLTYKNVGDLMGVTAQSINHLVNRSPEDSFGDIAYIKHLCKTLNIDYQYFNDLCDTVRNIIK